MELGGGLINTVATHCPNPCAGSGKIHWNRTTSPPIAISISCGSHVACQSVRKDTDYNAKEAVNVGKFQDPADI